MQSFNLSHLIYLLLSQIHLISFHSHLSTPDHNSQSKNSPICLFPSPTAALLGVLAPAPAPPLKTTLTKAAARTRRYVKYTASPSHKRSTPFTALSIDSSPPGFTSYLSWPFPSASSLFSCTDPPLRATITAPATTLLPLRATITPTTTPTMTAAITTRIRTAPLITMMVMGTRTTTLGRNRLPQARESA